MCLERLLKGDEARRLPCAHTFHRTCIDSWLLVKRKCPLCNLNIVEHFGLMDRDSILGEGAGVGEDEEGDSLYSGTQSRITAV